jgi:hypothetical protein
LAVVPEHDLRAPEWPGLGLAAPFGPRATGCEPTTLAPGARRTLDRCAVVGVTERLDETIDALARLIGRPLGAAPMINASGNEDDTGVSADDAAAVRRRSPTDEALVRDADRRLDAALGTLPPLPPPGSWPLTTLPFELGMADAFTGTGWHGRVYTEHHGWHRWSGPGVRSTVWLPVRAHGRVRVELVIAATAEADTLDGARLMMQGKPVGVRCTRDTTGIVLSTTCEADETRPLDLDLTIRRAALLHDAETRRTSTERAGIALTTVRIAAADGDLPDVRVGHLRSLA